MTRNRRMALGLAALLSLPACRDMAGGNQVDALQKSKTAAAAAGAQMQQRFKEGLRAAGPSDEQMRDAMGEK